MNVGQQMLIDEFGSVLGVAKAYLRGEVTTFEEHVSSICDRTDIAAAEAAIRLERDYQ